MKDYILTKYECSRIIGLRAAQLSSSAPVLTQVPSHLQTNFLYIANKELIEGKLDVIVQRPLPHNSFRNIHLKDMEIPEDLTVLEEMESIIVSILSN